jgi:6-phosphogluconolactonase
MKPLTSFSTRDALMQATAARIADALNKAISARGQACAALSGGSTPEPAYRALAAMALDWTRITFLLVDERFVPPTHEASNEAMLRRTLAPALAAGAKLLPMFAADATLEEAASHANTSYLGKQIDIAVMGMGADGHTASWFPQSPELEAVLDLSSARDVMAIHAPGAAGSAERLTLTRSAIAKAGALVLLISGEDKRTVLTSVAAHAPVAALFSLPSPAEILWAA